MFQRFERIAILDPLDGLGQAPRRESGADWPSAAASLHAPAALLVGRPALHLVSEQRSKTMAACLRAAAGELAGRSAVADPARLPAAPVPGAAAGAPWSWVASARASAAWPNSAEGAPPGHRPGPSVTRGCPAACRSSASTRRDQRGAGSLPRSAARLISVMKPSSGFRGGTSCGAVRKRHGTSRFAALHRSPAGTRSTAGQPRGAGQPRSVCPAPWLIQTLMTSVGSALSVALRARLVPPPRRPAPRRLGSESSQFNIHSIYWKFLQWSIWPMPWGAQASMVLPAQVPDPSVRGAPSGEIRERDS